MYLLEKSTDQSKSQVPKINELRQDSDLSGLQKLNALETLILYLIDNFGPLTSNKVFELVSCFGSHGVVDKASSIEKMISNTLQSLMLESHKILYCSETGNWRLNDGEQNSLGLQPINNRRFPKLTLRNSFSPDLPLNYKGVGNEFVYVVYQSESRVESVLRDRDNWLLKVGRTNNLRRRVSQLSESGPNSLVIGIAFKTYNSRGLEKYIHQSLHNQKKACDIPGRKEWFFSNLAEIEDLRGQFELKSLLVA